MINNLIRIKNYLFLLFSIGFIMFISFLKQNNNDSKLMIDNKDRFVNNDQISQMVDEMLKDSLNNNLYDLEKKINSNDFIKKIEIFKNLNNIINIKIDQYKPYARLVNENGDDYYIDYTGKIFPTSIKYSERVLLVNFHDINKFTDEKNIKSFKKGDKIFKLIKYINNDSFLKKQISQINILNDGEIIMIPQVTKQKIFFGKADEIALKFEKLNLFYKTILPTKGWNYYESVNLKFKDQIVCNKNDNT